MTDTEQMLSSLLSDPKAMEQIMNLAQSLGGPPQEQPKENTAPSLPSVDPAMLGQLAAMARGTGVDRNQRALLTALSPYLSRSRVGKLEKAMEAAKLASFAATMLNRRSGHV